MLIYAIIMFLTAVLFFVMSAAIYKGKTDLIHSYHQTNITDQAAYGKAFGKSLSVVAMALLFSGIVSLLEHSKSTAWAAVAVLMIGLGIGIALLIKVQKKYNKGIF